MLKADKSDCDVLIIGCGITGLAIANELVRANFENIIIIDKENHAGAHASGRNSGVLHSGVYYSPGSLKARFCVEGNKLMREYCEENGLTIKNTGKVIVATDEKRLENLYELKRRAKHAGATANIIDEKELREIEPNAYTLQKALYCPDTSVVKPGEILSHLIDKLTATGKVKIKFGTSFIGLSAENKVKTSDGEIEYKKIINAAGAYAEKIAQCFGLGREYNLIPFKGTYKKLKKESSELVKGNIYPVPDLNNPFLGVHFTKSVDGTVFAGPTAIPALSRENYNLFENLDGETLEILFRDGLLTLLSGSFRSAAVNEIKKYFDHYFYHEAKTLVPNLKPGDLVSSGKVGIRPQLVHWPEKKLVMDFIVLKEGDSVHVLNAISPGFTTSMAFSRHVVDMLEGKND
ncbi:MAG: L-2-hydroxyglutarate oxidase [Candidatus Dadabacteria bacterium]|nr:L-2-hydroxyglutarate oxidase [Candidatus Dadabacteria bacterium]NIS08411.1 L-2-hydroxyglutarate oxidase [Candidatus Dadabacteria bacterium]NIV41330.1 L-2-hydroxyglutarate oxidase [Candidatus Dadabacteria bacterium]NIY22400.1 L-2-hydroxyglutarate oxidase [Candidatus Dadabacteria bacterium]